MFIKGDQHQHVMFPKHKFLLFFPTVSVMVALMSALVSLVLSAIAAAIVTSIIAWCVMKKRYKHPQSTSDRGMQDDKSGAHELTLVVYDVPVLKDHHNQTISTQDNVAYAGTIPLQKNVAYEHQVYMFIDSFMLALAKHKLYAYSYGYSVH